MNKSKLAERILEQTGGNPFITVNGLIKLLHTSHKAVSDLTEDLVPVSRATRANKAKYYFVDDIAEAIMRKGI